MAILKALPRTKYSVRQNKHLPVMRYVPSFLGKNQLCFTRTPHQLKIKFLYPNNTSGWLEDIRDLRIELQRLIEGKIL